MRLKFILSRLIFEDVASAAGHDIGTSNGIENLEKFLEMLQGALVTILARESHLDFFQQSQHMLRVPLVVMLAQEMRMKRFTTPWKSCEVR